MTNAVPPIHLTPATRELSVASDWFKRFEGAGLDTVMAKPISGTYQSDKRAMFKVKHERDCDCVVAGVVARLWSDGRSYRSAMLGTRQCQGSAVSDSSTARDVRGSAPAVRGSATLEGFPGHIVRRADT